MNGSNSDQRFTATLLITKDLTKVTYSVVNAVKYLETRSQNECIPSQSRIQVVLCIKNSIPGNSDAECSFTFKRNLLYFET